jgi:hypothetical protein
VARLLLETKEEKTGKKNLTFPIVFFTFFPSLEFDSMIRLS